MPSSDHPPVLRLATVNAAGGRDLGGTDVDVERLASAVAGLGVDVVALQEVDHHLRRSGDVDQAAVVAGACGADGRPWSHAFVAAVRGTPGEDAAPAPDTVQGLPSYGVALLTPLPVLERDELRMHASRAKLPMLLPTGASHRLRWFDDEQRVAAASVLQTPLGALTVVTTHLSFFPPRALGQLREVRDWAARLPRPLVLLGDLNLPAGVPDRVTGWGSLVRGPTFPAPDPRVQLDHVLADGLTWPVRGTEVTRVGGSDHRGVVVTLGG
ncbi:endonuclease/exonuclease/phosphatase family protein [Solicola sp. PLA-1-18]|uniref:endonuclease/exonuclease/phosphatase family protein n=1 Tax=Solicola sp. PLA-1-18 TaxID=3380532 RepID=UPI003B793BF1